MGMSSLQELWHYSCETTLAKTFYGIETNGVEVGLAIIGDFNRMSMKYEKVKADALGKIQNLRERIGQEHPKTEIGRSTIESVLGRLGELEQTVNSYTLVPRCK